jgi:phospholipase C
MKNCRMRKVVSTFIMSLCIAILVSCAGSSGSSGNESSSPNPPTSPGVAITANPGTINATQTSTLTVTASNAAAVVITNNLDSSQYVLPASGGTQKVTPAKTITYTATASGADNQTATAKITVKVNQGSLLTSANHIIFMMQENRTFDHYFGMLNPYRRALGWNIGDDGNTYDVDGIDDKLTTISNQNDEGDVFPLFKLKSTCIDDDSSAWLPSWGSVNRYDFNPTRRIEMDGFVHTAEGFAKHCVASGSCSGGEFTDLVGQRAMGYYDQDYLNYYYYMASQFAVSDRWFSPIASESIPNRIATLTGGTTQGLVWNPGQNDGLPQLNIQTIFQELDNAGVSWKIYYSTTNDNCSSGDNFCGQGVQLGKVPSTTFTYFSYSTHFLSKNLSHGACTPPKQQSGAAVGDPNNDFCIDVSHIAPIGQFLTDMNSGKLPSFAWVEPGYSHTDEHPGSGQSILRGQASIAALFNAFMSSPSWHDSIFFWSYDEGGGPYDHVPPVPGHTNDFTDPSLGITTDISSIAVNPDAYGPCAPPHRPNPPGPATLHCDLHTVPFNDPGVDAGDAAAIDGFKAQLGFRLPNLVLSPFARRHYVSHVPMDHTAVITLVERRFLNGQTLTARDAAQPDLMDFFDFTNVPWLIPPSNVPVPYDPSQAGATCTANNM